MAKSEPLKSTFSIRSLLDQNDHQGIDANNDVSDEANEEAVVGIIEEENEMDEEELPIDEVVAKKESEEENEKELTTNNYFEDTFKKFSSVSNKKFQFFETLTKNKFKFFLTKELIYSLSIFGFVFIFAFLLFCISQSNKNDSKIRNKSFVLEKIF